MTLEFIDTLVMRWRAEADRLERLGQPGAPLGRAYADELEQAVRQWELEALTLDQASKESGYSYAHLHRLVAERQVENVGKDGAPRVRRCDLPSKPGRGPRPQTETPDLATEILARRAGS